MEVNIIDRLNEQLQHAMTSEDTWEYLTVRKGDIPYMCAVVERFYEPAL
jgi:hypothetical protein